MNPLACCCVSNTCDAAHAASRYAGDRAALLGAHQREPLGQYLRHAAAKRLALSISVNTGTSSQAGVEPATQAGFETLIPYHHWPAGTLPAAAVIVNPNSPGDAFPSKALAGVGVRAQDGVAALAMTHNRHLVTWYGATGAGGVIHTINPRLFDDQLDYIVNHAEDRILIYDAMFQPIVDRMKPRWPTVEPSLCFDAARENAPLFDVANAGSGFLQVMLLLALMLTQSRRDEIEHGADVARGARLAVHLPGQPQLARPAAAIAARDDQLVAREQVGQRIGVHILNCDAAERNQHHDQHGRAVSHDSGGQCGPRLLGHCLLYTSDAADERSSVDLGGRRIIKKKNT